MLSLGACTANRAQQAEHLGSKASAVREVNGGGLPVNGGGIPLNGGGIPLNGGGIPLNGGGIPLNGGGIPSNGGGIPANGGGIPANGGGLLTVDSTSGYLYDQNGTRYNAYALPFSNSHWGGFYWDEGHINLYTGYSFADWVTDGTNGQIRADHFVRCALGPTDNIDVYLDDSYRYTLTGQLNLAPSIKNNPGGATDADRRALTSCMSALINTSGARVHVDLLGTRDSVWSGTTSLEVRSFPQWESAMLGRFDVVRMVTPEQTHCYTGYCWTDPPTYALAVFALQHIVGSGNAPASFRLNGSGVTESADNGVCSMVQSWSTDGSGYTEPVYSECNAGNATAGWAEPVGVTFSGSDITTVYRSPGDNCDDGFCDSLESSMGSCPIDCGN
jgi:hypothetical protein